MSDPWLKFYPSDWRSDPKLRLVSMAARGLWIEMIGYMHEAEIYGELTINGISLDASKLSKVVGESIDDVKIWMDELEASGVYSVRKNKIIYSRRMEKDEIKRRKLRENGKKGGNPSLSKQTIKKSLVNQEDKTTEARSQKPDKNIDKKYLENGFEEKFNQLLSVYPVEATNFEKCKQTFADQLGEGDPHELIIFSAQLVRNKHTEKSTSEKKFTQRLNNWLEARNYENDRKAWELSKQPKSTQPVRQPPKAALPANHYLNQIDKTPDERKTA